jgi:hypothetical protein
MPSFRLFSRHRFGMVTLLCAALGAMAAAKPAAPAVTFTSDAFGNNFVSDSGQVVLHFGQGMNAGGGHVRVTDEQGRSLQEQPIPPGNAPLTIPLKGKGYYQITATVTGEDGKEFTAKTSASVVGALLPNEVRLAAPFGFFSVRGDTPLPVIAGTGWNRLFIPSHAIRFDASGLPQWPHEQPPHPKNPATFDGKPAPLHWVGVFMYPPASLVAPEYRAKQSNGNVHPPTDWKAFSKVITFAAKHYSQWVDYFEPINEPDANWRGNDEELVRYHAAIADAVHAANPQAKVVGPCLSSIDIPHLRKLAALGLFDHLDGVSIHAYVNGVPPEGKWWNSVLELKEFMRSIGKAKMPLVISEYGWQTAAGDWARPVDQLSQARYAARSLTLLAAEQVSAINYFCLRYDDPRIPFVQGWSVVEKDNTPRPAFAAIANVSHWLAGVEGPGTVLHPAPDSYLVLFKKGSGSVAVAWTTQGESTLQIPGHWQRVNGMMGRTLTPDAHGMVALTESPTFIELDDGALPAIQTRKPVSVIRGREIDLPGDWNGATVSAPLTLQGDHLAVPDSAAAGEYLVMARSADGNWSAAPVQVLPRFAVESAQIRWPDGRPAPVVRMNVRAYGNVVNIQPIVRLNGAAPRFGGRVDIPADQTVSVDVPLDNLPLDRRWTGVAAVEARVNGRVESAETPLDVALVPGGFAVPASETIDWSPIPQIGSSGWSSFGPGTDGKPPAPEDCSATLQWTWSDQGLHFHIQVRDDVHVQTREPAQMWQQDSLQFAFDVDADQPWKMNVNNDVVGLNGHRIFEYGVALRDGQSVTARWRDAIVKLPDHLPPIAAHVRRDGDQTIYDVTFPWAVLGLSQAPAANTSIGFDLVVNDMDAPPSRRHGLEIFSGINSSKDPETYGRLLLRKTSQGSPR